MGLLDLIYHEPATIWKSACVNVGNDKYMIILYYYRSNKQDKSKSFYKCNIRIDTKDNWMKLRNSLIESDPAQTFTVDLIGIDDPDVDPSYMPLKFCHRVFNKVDVYRWLGSKFSESKIRKLEDFLKKEFSPMIKNQYLRKYMINNQEVDISEIDKIPCGKWFTSTKEHKTHETRKKYGTIIH